MYLSVGAFACVDKCRSFGAQYAFVCVYPGFHIGLCPHSTLGYAGVSCLRHSELASILMSLLWILSRQAHQNIWITRRENKACASYSQNLGEVCINFSWSLCRLRLKFVQTTAEVSRKYYVLTNLSTRAHWNKYTHLQKYLCVLTALKSQAH